MLVFVICLLVTFLAVETGIAITALRTDLFMFKVLMGVLFVVVGIFVIALCTVLFGLTLIF